MAHGNEIGLTGDVLLLEQRHWVGPVSGGLPTRMSRWPRLLASSLPERSSLLDAQVLDLVHDEPL